MSSHEMFVSGILEAENLSNMFDDVDDTTFGIEEGPTPSPIEEGVVVVQPPEFPLDLSATQQAELEQLFTSCASDFGIYQFSTAVSLITSWLT